MDANDIDLCLRRISEILHDTRLHLGLKEQWQLYSRPTDEPSEWRTLALASSAKSTPCIAIEDYSCWVLQSEEFGPLIEQLDDKLPEGTTDEAGATVRFAQLLVNDLLFFSCIVPSVTVKYDECHRSPFLYLGELSRYSIHCITPALCIQAIKELIQRVEGSFEGKEKGLLGHLAPPKLWAETRPQLSLAQAMVDCSLLNFSTELRKEMAADKLFLRLRANKHLVQWMLACSNSDEQQFLNTCDATAGVTGLIHNYSLVSSIIVYSRRVVGEIKTAIPNLEEEVAAYPYNFGLPLLRPKSRRRYVADSLHEFEKFVNWMESEVTRMCDRLDKGQQVSLQEMVKPVRNWHRAMQKLAAVFYPEAPAVASTKPFSQQWHLSAAMMAVYAWSVQWWSGQPTFLSRSRAAHQIDALPQVWLHTFQLNLDCKQDGSVYLGFANRVRSLLNNEPDKARDLVSKLWTRLVMNGGKLYNSVEHVWNSWWVGHVCFIFAIVIPKSTAQVLEFSHKPFDTAHPYRAAAWDLAMQLLLPKAWLQGQVVLPVKEPNPSNVSLRKDALFREEPGVTRAFLIADPEIRWYKLLTFSQMEAMIANVEYAFDLTNTSHFQLQRPN